MDEQVSENEEKMAGLITSKADLETQMKEMEERLLDEEDAVADLEGSKKKLGAEIEDLRADVEDLEQSLSKVRHYQLLSRYYMTMLSTKGTEDFLYVLVLIPHNLTKFGSCILTMERRQFLKKTL